MFLFFAWVWFPFFQDDVGTVSGYGRVYERYREGHDDTSCALKMGDTMVLSSYDRKCDAVNT